MDIKPPFNQDKEIPLRLVGIHKSDNDRSNHHRKNNETSSGSAGSENGANLYHTLRYDFKPASVNLDEAAQIDLTPNGQVSIKAPNVGGSSTNYTLFRGQRRPHIKECLMILDNRTGEVTLQKLTDNITVKATRTLNGPSSNGVASGGPLPPTSQPTTTAPSSSARPASNNSNNNSNNSFTNNQTDGPQLSEESSSSESDSDDDDDDSGSSSSSSSSSSSDSSANDDGFKF